MPDENGHSPAEPSEDPSQQVIAQIVVTMLADGNLHVLQQGAAEQNKVLAVGMLQTAATVIVSPPQPAKPPIELVRASNMPGGGF